MIKRLLRRPNLWLFCGVPYPTDLLRYSNLKSVSKLLRSLRDDAALEAPGQLELSRRCDPKDFRFIFSRNYLNFGCMKGMIELK